MSKNDLDLVLAHIDAHIEEATHHLFELLKIPSISTDPAYKKDCAIAADWLVEDLRKIGFDASKRETNGHPMVVGHTGISGKHIMFYGHYDVQPIDPIELWEIGRSTRLNSSHFTQSRMPSSA